MGGATLNQRETEAVNRLEELRTHLREGTRLVTGDQLAEAETNAGFALANAEAREQARQASLAEADAKAAAQQQRRDAAVKAAQDAFLREARARFPGTDAEWEQAKGEVLKQWQIRQALSDDDAAQQAQRQLYNRF